MDLHSQLRSVNYTVFMRKRNNFEPNQHVVVATSRCDDTLKAKNDKTMSGILSFISILYLKQ